ncbi:sulfate ABC transporter permease [Neorhizobium sp. NCHU2750]|nr:sulfate ABC transporter permease [Neorhizobium sp. NCHU2750]
MVRPGASRARRVPSMPALPFFILPACLLCVLPFAVLLWQTGWSDFHFAYGDGDAVEVSMSLGLISIILIFLLGTPVALWLARTRSRLKPLVELAVLAVLLTPPLGMGIVLLSVYGPYATVGSLLGRIGLELNNNAGAFILSQVYGGIAYFIMAASAAFEGVPVDAEEAAMVLGARGFQIFRLVTLPLAARGLAAGLIVAWVRVIGEFGIVTIFAYFPQGIPVKLYVNLQNDGIDQVYALLWLMLAVTLPLPLAGLALLKRRN